MADTRLLEIAEKLLKRTRNGEVNWRETVDSNGNYIPIYTSPARPENP